MTDPVELACKLLADGIDSECPMAHGAKDGVQGLIAKTKYGLASKEAVEYRRGYQNGAKKRAEVFARAYN